MKPWLLLGGGGLLAAAAYFLLREPDAADGGSAGMPGAARPSGVPAIDAEFQAATAALLASYRAHGGCPGLDQATVLRFQRALNAYRVAIGARAVLAEDGIYDTTTDTILADLTNTPGFPACAVAFVPPPAPAEGAATRYASVNDARYDPTKSTLALARWGSS